MPARHSVQKKTFRLSLFDPRLQAALLFCLAVFGYWAVAPFLQLISPSSAEASIAFRALILVLCLAVLVNPRARSLGNTSAVLFPFILFIALYAYRMYDNYFLEVHQIYIEPLISFSFLFGAGLVPALVLARISRQLSDEALVIVMPLLFLVFMAGLAFNIDELRQSAENRMHLHKVNPIAMAATAFSFLMFFLAFWRGSRLLRYLGMASIPVLIAIIAFSKSRGPMMAAAGSILLYFLLIKGPHRIRLLQGLTVLTAALAIIQYFTPLDLVGMALSRFDSAHESNLISIEGRTLAWQAAWEQFLEDPFFGRLMYEKALFHYPHNIILEALMATGVVGGFFLIWHLGLAFTSAAALLRSPQTSIFPAFIVLIFFKEFLQSMFSGAIWGVSGLWISSCCVIALNAARLVELRRLQRSRFAYAR